MSELVLLLSQVLAKLLAAISSSFKRRRWVRRTVDAASTTSLEMHRQDPPTGSSVVRRSRTGDRSVLASIPPLLSLRSFPTPVTTTGTNRPDDESATSIVSSNRRCNSRSHSLMGNGSGRGRARRELSLFRELYQIEEESSASGAFDPVATNEKELRSVVSVDGGTRRRSKSNHGRLQNHNCSRSLPATMEMTPDSKVLKKTPSALVKSAATKRRSAFVRDRSCSLASQPWNNAVPRPRSFSLVGPSAKFRLDVNKNGECNYFDAEGVRAVDGSNSTTNNLDDRSERSLDSGMFTGSDAASTSADADTEKGGAGVGTTRRQQRRWLRSLARLFGKSHIKSKLGTNDDDDESTRAPSNKPQKAGTAEGEQRQNDPSHNENRRCIARQKLIRRQLRHHTFGRVKHFVASQWDRQQELRRRNPADSNLARQPGEPTSLSMHIIKHHDFVVNDCPLRRSQSTPGSPLQLSRCSSPLHSPRPTPSSPTQTHSSSLGTRTSPNRSPMWRFGVSSGSCSEVEWRNRVWLELTQVSEEPFEPVDNNGSVTLQLCHVCLPTCNYRQQRSFVKGDLNQVLWYRFLGR